MRRSHTKYYGKIAKNKFVAFYAQNLKWKLYR